jgi:membrane protein
VQQETGFFKMIRMAAREWSNDNAQRLGAALAYYTVFSIAPLLLITIAVVGFVLGPAAAKGQVADVIKSTTGDRTAGMIQTMIASADKPRSGIIATLLGLVMLIFGALGVFTQLKSALNTVWDVGPKPNPGIKYYILTYLFSFGMVLGIGFLLLVSLIITTALSAIGAYFHNLLPGGAILWHIVNIVVSFGVIILLFAMLFKYLPDVTIRWKDVWVGAIFTAALFTAGKWALGLYLSRGTVSSAYGAAGSLAVLLVWVYYSAQILFFGAEMTQVWANTHGSQIVPKSHARRLGDNQQHG